jgi:hypothetical protein
MVAKVSFALTKLAQRSPAKSSYRAYAMLQGVLQPGWYEPVRGGHTGRPETVESAQTSQFAGRSRPG